MKYYLKAIWYLLCIAAITLAVIGILATIIYFIPTMVFLAIAVVLILVCFGGIIKDIADDIKWNEHWNKDE
jgi:hypothetical protein